METILRFVLNIYVAAFVQILGKCVYLLDAGNLHLWRSILGIAIRNTVFSNYWTTLFIAIILLATNTRTVIVNKQKSTEQASVRRKSKKNSGPKTDRNK